jgi:hypothetical protein
MKTLIAVMLLSSAAMAEDFTIKLTGPELDIVGKGLGTQPFNDVAPLLQKLREQVQAQQPKPVEPAKAEEKKE